MAGTRLLEAASAGRIFTAVIAPDEEDGGFVVTFPDLPDLATQGETIEDARWMAEDCLRGYLDVLRNCGRPMPGTGAPVPPDDSIALRFSLDHGRVIEDHPLL